MKSKWSMVLGVMLVFGLVFMACDTGTNGSADIIPIELQGTWIGNAGKIIMDGTSITIQPTGDSIRNVPVKNVQKGSVQNGYTVYTLIPTNGGNNALVGLSQDGLTILDGDGYYFTKQ